MVVNRYCGSKRPHPPHDYQGIGYGDARHCAGRGPQKEAPELCLCGAGTPSQCQRASPREDYCRRSCATGHKERGCAPGCPCAPPTPAKRKVRIVLQAEGDWWVVTREDRDCASQGRTPVEALRNFAEAWEIRYGGLGRRR